MKKIFFVLLILFLTFKVHSEDLLSDVPKGHWAREAVEKLLEDGVLENYPDKTFKGDQVVTRYELAQVVYKIIERVEKLEMIISGAVPGKKGEKKLSAEDLALVESLKKEFKPEVESLGKKIGKLETKVTEMEKDLKKQEKELKGVKTDLKKELKERDRNYTILKKRVETLEEKQQLIKFSGSADYSMTNVDYGVSGIAPTNYYSLDVPGKYLGRAPRSNFYQSISLNINFKATPTATTGTNKTVTVSGDFSMSRGGGGDTGARQPLSLDSGFVTQAGITPTLGSLYIDYSASLEKFRRLSVGSTSASWTMLSLSQTGFSYRGLYLAGTIGKIGVDLAIAKPQYAHGDNWDESITPPWWTTYYYSEYLYAINIGSSFIKGYPLNFTYMHNYHDQDSIAVHESKKDSSAVKPDKIEAMSVKALYKFTPTLILDGEYSLSKYTQWDGATYVLGTDNIARRREVKTTSVQDSAILGFLTYNKRGLGIKYIYARQNPNYHNRYGGILSIMNSFGGEGVSLGGIDMGSLLKGLQLDVLWITYTPRWAKGLTIQPIYGTGGEIEPSSMSKMAETLAGSTGTQVPIDKDWDKRKNTLKINPLIYAMIRYAPSAKTTLSINLLYLEAGFDKEIVRGTYGTYTQAVQPPDPNLPDTDPRQKNPYVEYQDAQGTWKEVVIQPTKVVFGSLDAEGNFVEESSQDINLYQEGSSVYLNIPGATGEHPYAGDYVYSPSESVMKEIWDKPLYLKIGFLQPTITLVHNFSQKLIYEISWQQDKPILYEGVRLGDVILNPYLKFGIKAETKTKINQKITYKLNTSMTLYFKYNMEFWKYFNSPQEQAICDGREERKTTAEFSLGVSF